MASMMLMVVAAGAVGSAAFATPSAGAPSPMQSEQSQVCQTVVTAEPGAKPYKLCMTRADWTAKKIADGKNANRIVCRYEEVPGSRFRSAKVCQAASEWATQLLLQRQELEQIQMQSRNGP